MDMQRLPQLLLPWYGENARDLPWRRDREPYHVWLSEIMLQQTRVEAVKGYYARFLAALPSIPALARAEEGTVLKLWEGLGYYSRARNLQRAAKSIMASHHGEFPGKYADIRALPGIGDYTAGAIASICFEAPTPAIDGNVLRIMARITGEGESIDAPQVKRRFHSLLASCYPPGRCGDFTQALMELGACVCPPRSPNCPGCPAADLCGARREGLEHILPRRGEKRPRRVEERSLFALTCNGRLAISKRPPKGLLAGLWELPSLPGCLDAQQALAQAAAWGLSPMDMDRRLSHTHIFTHVEWHMQCHFIRCARMEGPFTWASPRELREVYALPSAFRPFLQALADIP